MIDLHMHSLYSDGTDKIVELLQKAESLKLDVIAITDHDNIEAHLELQKINPTDYYKGKILIGAEFKTFYQGVTIEILGYNFDLEQIKKVNYLRIRSSEKQKKILSEFKAIGKRIGLKFDENIDLDEIDIFASSVFAKEIFKYEENIPILIQNGFNPENGFYRYAQTNPDSIFYIDEAKYFPTIEQIITDIHNAGGLTFLAHPLIYSFSDKLNTIEKIITTYDFDGIECYYSSFNEEDTNDLIKLAQKLNKFISGGSDYHGLYKPNIEIGIGEGNLNIPLDIIRNWANIE